MISKSDLFKSAHKETRRILQAGDNYQATFGLVLRKRYANLRKRAAEDKLETVGFNKWQGRRLYWNSKKCTGATVYLDIETNKWIAKGYQSRAAKAEALEVYNQIMGV